VQLAFAKDPDASFFKRLEGLQPCEVSELKAGTHIFAVYGDNFFKSARYTIEAICMDSFVENVVKLKEVEAQLLAKRGELRQFEIEYREVIPLFPIFHCLSSPLHFCIICAEGSISTSFL
jgi:hypothetical protein